MKKKYVFYHRINMNGEGIGSTTTKENDSKASSLTIESKNPKYQKSKRGGVVVVTHAVV